MTESNLPNHETPWSSDEEERLRELYPDADSTELVTEFGRTYEAIKARATKLGVSKSEDYQTPVESDEEIQRGAAAEAQFEAYVENQGWTWFRNSTFRNYPSWEREYESVTWQLGLADEDWFADEMKQRNETKKQELETALDKPRWFRELRKDVTTVLEAREETWTAYPDYVIGGWSWDPGFVEVKYGSSNLSEKQRSFFEFLQSNGYPVKIFRVTPTQNERLYEWDGGWT